MEQKGIGVIEFAGTPDFAGHQFVAFASSTVTGRVSMMFDKTETRQLHAEFERAAVVAFGPNWKDD